MAKQRFLFEVSWEVCNKVGGIYTVIRSKLKQATKSFGSNYVLIGPLLESNPGFVESSSGECDSIKKVLTEKNIQCRVGYWDDKYKPLVILVEYKSRYHIDILLYSLWADFGVDSLASNYDYQEPILFSTAAGEVISALSENLLQKNMKVIAQFHEWLCGAGLLYLKKQATDVVTVFTTHATVLGRSLANQNKLIYNLPSSFDANAEAKKLGVFAKHSIEKASAKEADCFTTVSSITADEANIILNKFPDKIIPNGLDIESKQAAILNEKIPQTRAKLLEIAKEVIGREIEPNALIWASSGRYEFHNKGFDIFLKSLASLENFLPKDSPQIIAFFLVAAAWHNAQDSLLNVGASLPGQKSALGIATHKLYNPDNDSIIKLVNELNLNQPYRKIHVIFSDAYLDGADGVFNIPYEQIMASIDLSVFPSFYEPWGYTPLESIAYTTPTITSDLAGFGSWISSLKSDYKDAVYILKRRAESEDSVVTELAKYFLEVVKQSSNKDFISHIKSKAFAIATQADWDNFYLEYLDAYEQAIKFNELYYAKFDPNDPENKFVTTIHEAEVPLPRFHSVQYESPLPEQLSDLRILAYNFWWSWHDEAKALFQKIDKDIWELSRHNPVHFLNLVSPSALLKAANDKNFMWLYSTVLSAFKSDTRLDKEIIKFCSTTIVSQEHPVAYFCMEYGIAECLPIYSGGLGVLAGDYLKAMSDLRVPLVAIGLFYSQGYFHQTINSQGEQVALYETWDPNQIPMLPVNDEAGNLLLTSIQILSRTVYIKAWEVKVGHVSLYLLDTNVPENSEDDRKITNNLYGGSTEVRLKQELVLGIGGARFLKDKLNIEPCLYHLNEGHSAFLLLERLRNYCHQEFSFEVSCELIRCSTIFTTHTPVAAGNEVFPEDLVKKYLVNFTSCGIKLEKVFGFARDIKEDSDVFSMTALALRLSMSANAVSTLHGYVARTMWKNLWPGLLDFEIPIGVVTNGIHLRTWLGSSMKLLYQDYVEQDWIKRQDDPKLWEQITKIPDIQVWKAHQIQKERLVEYVKKVILEQYTLRDETKLQINASLNSLNVNALLIGLSRRFTSYKRNDLILIDRERLARVLTNPKRPVVMLIAGKAHPADSAGKELIRQVMETLRDSRFEGHIIFLEEYNFGLAKLLVQGVDLWINTPILGHEACGTSGMKVAVNGGLNFSTRDGWWDEAYNPEVGWKVESLTSIADIDKRNDIENAYLLNTLESEIVPLYYAKNRSGFSPDWVKKMKASIQLVACQYNTTRMVHDYVNQLYCPTLLQFAQGSKDNYADIKAIASWKANIVDSFNTVKIKAILINGIKNGKITSDGLIQIKVLIFSGKLSAHELKVECVLVKQNGDIKANHPIIIELKKSVSRESGVLIYVADYKIADTGFYFYGIRIFPYNSMLFRQQDAGVVIWG